jgi:TolB-like protein/Flp pilus assembly protein TadD
MPDSGRPTYVQLPKWRKAPLLWQLDVRRRARCSATVRWSDEGGGSIRRSSATRASAILALSAGRAARLAGGVSYRVLPNLKPASVHRAVVVLPLENLSGDPDQEYFAAAMHSALIGELGRIGALRVISRTSAVGVRAAGLALPEIASMLAVDLALEGSVMREGDDVRIRVHLLETRPRERQIWTQEFRRRAADALAIHGDIARAVADAVRIELAPGESARLASAHAMTPATYEAYLRGLYHLDLATPAEAERGLRYLHEAVDADPANARVLAALAEGYIRLGHGFAPPDGARERAREAAQRAIRLQPDLAEAHAALATALLYYEYDFAGAERHFLRARELNPNLAMNHYHYAWYLALFDRLDEAIAAHQRARSLDPLDPLHTTWLGLLYLMAGRPDDGMREARHALELAPRAPGGWFVLGDAYALKGMHDDAVAAHRRLTEWGPPFAWPLAITCALAGRLDCARAAIAELEALPPNAWNAFGLAAAYSAVGEPDRALEWLRYEPRHAWFPWIRNIDWFAGLWGDPRFDALLAGHGLPPRRGE